MAERHRNNRLTFTYDAAGHRLTARDGDGAGTLTYDALNRVAMSVGPWGKVHEPEIK